MITANRRPKRTALATARKPTKGEMGFQVIDKPVFAVAGFWQRTKEGGEFAMAMCDPNEPVALIQPKTMSTILHPDGQERWLTGSYDDVRALQCPGSTGRMTVRGPVFPTRDAN